ncbi:MAG: DUF4857 domain-containing protein [Bacteroidales bacterium]|nr:DUF4857 domain-containing protein [Bacteroidales bacterium]
MIKFSKILLATTIVILLFWQLPWCYSFLNSQASNSPFTMYSTIINEFIFSESDGKTMKHYDLKGNLYSQNEADSLMPFFYARQLVNDGKFPDSIKGIAINYKDVQTASFYFRHNPKDINRPQIGLYQLLESLSGRVKLETPDDVFRITNNNIEFIECQTNTVNIEKSKLFTDMFIKKGFVFPSKEVSGNPSVKKDYDEGYVILDSNSQLFHFKQIKGRPYLRKIDIPNGMVLEHIFITEFRNKKTLAFACDKENKFYAIEFPKYNFEEIKIGPFNPKNQSMMIYANLMDWTVKLSSLDKVEYFAIDANNYSLLSKYEVPKEKENLMSKFGDFISSVQLHFKAPFDEYVFPKIGY